jgi:uncharacterized protein YeeX (DUF496 family)
MMTFDEILEAVKHLTPEQKDTLRQALDEQPDNGQTLTYDDDLTPQERAAQLHAAFEKMREGLSEEDLKEITEAMNGDYYTEPSDESVQEDT